MSTSVKPRNRWLRVIAPVAAAAFAIGGLGLAQATTSATGRGEMEFGRTVGFYQGSAINFTYTKGFFCDTSVTSAAVTGCEVGKKWNHAPNTQHDPLYITVPLGFTVPMARMDCPAGLKCVDHPATVDLTRLANALAPIFKTTPAKLLPALRNFATPGHDHFLTDLNNRLPEWWDVYVVGVTSPTVYANIHNHGSFKYIQSLIAAKNRNKFVAIGPTTFGFFAAISDWMYLKLP
jgi:hypothetical protein